MSIWIKTNNKSFLRPVHDEKGIPTAKDKKYTIMAIPVTMSKFGPSGSLKNKNSILEHRIAVMPRMSNEKFFDLKYILRGKSLDGAKI